MQRPSGLASEFKRILCELLWVHIRAGESILSNCTVIDFECDITRHVLISEIDLAEL